MIYPGINNLELNRKITKIIFRLNYGIFHIHKSPEITFITIFVIFTPNTAGKTKQSKLKFSGNLAYVCALLDSCICHVHGALANATELRKCPNSKN